MITIVFDHGYSGYDQTNGHPNYRFAKFWNDDGSIPSELDKYGYHTTDRYDKPYVQFDNEDYPFPPYEEMEILTKEDGEYSRHYFY